MPASLLPRLLPGSTEVSPIPSPSPGLGPDEALLLLQATVDQLTRPTVVRLHRDIPAPGSDAWQQAHDDRELATDRWHAVAAAALAQDLTAARSALRDLEVLQRRHAARSAPTVPVPSLLTQLQAEIPNGGDSGHSAPGTGATRSPLALSALDLAAAIAATTGFRGAPSSPGLVRHVQAWCASVSGDRARVVAAASAAAGWPDQARAVLTPARRWTAPGQCPDCGKAVAHVEQDGESVRVPAIEFDREQGTARCRRCPARWDTEAQLHQLAKVLIDQQTT